MDKIEAPRTIQALVCFFCATLGRIRRCLLFTACFVGAVFDVFCYQCERSKVAASRYYYARGRVTRRTDRPTHTRHDSKHNRAQSERFFCPLGSRIPLTVCYTLPIPLQLVEKTDPFTIVYRGMCLSFIMFHKQPIKRTNNIFFYKSVIFKIKNKC